MKKQLITMMCILIGVISIAAILPNKSNPPKYKNLKVLPKNIAEAKLDSIMDQYNVALSVNCDFCHTKKGEGLAFELDTKSEKKITRKMMLMTYDINTKHFYEKPNRLDGQRVTCNTCHNGNAIPAETE